MTKPIQLLESTQKFTIGTKQTKAVQAAIGEAK